MIEFSFKTCHVALFWTIGQCFFGCNQTKRESMAEKLTKNSPNIHQIQSSADSHEIFSATIFTSFSSFTFEGISDGKTFIGNLLFVGGNLF